MIRPLRATVLIGREPEVGAVRQAVLSARRGTGGLVLVTGEAGVGKSRLIAEATRLAHSMGVPVLAGQAVPDGGAFRAVAEALYGYLRDSTVSFDDEELRPFGPALARLLPGWVGTETVPTVDPLVILGEGVVRLLRHLGGDRGCLLILEDVHWADRDTLGLLEYLAGAVSGSPVVVAVTARSDEEQPEQLRRLSTRPGVVRVALDRLSAAAVERLASACAGGDPLPAEVVRFLVTAAEGLPFLVEELLAGLAESGSLVRDGAWTVPGELTAQVPQTLADLVRRRMSGLPPEHRRVVQAAAVSGRSVDWSLLAPAVAVPEEVVAAALRGAVSAYLLEADPKRPDLFVWRHALVREAVLGDLLPPEHALLARRLAEVLEERDPDLVGPDAALVAELYVTGGRPAHAARLLVAQAQRAVAGGALRTAEAVLARAADLDADVDVERVRLLTLAGRGEEALAVGEAALSGSRGEGRVALYLNLARAAVAVARWEQAFGYLDRAGRPGDPRVDALAADAAYGAGRIAEAAALAAGAVDAAERVGFYSVACEALEVVARCARMSDPDAASAALRRAADLAETHGLVPWRIHALLGLGFVELLATETSIHLAQARELARDAGMLADVAGIDMVLANARLLVEGPAPAAVLAEGSYRAAALLRLRQVEAKALIGMASGHLAADRTDAMRAALAEAERVDPGAADVVGGCAGTLAVHALLNHDLPATRDHLDRAVAALRTHATAAPMQEWGLWALIRTVLADRDTAARDELRDSDLTARAVNRAGLIYADAVAAGRTGGPAEALFADGDALLPTQHWWRRLLRLLVLEAAVLDGWGRPVEKLRADLAAFEAAGETRLARTSRDLLRRAGAAVPRRGRGTSTVPPRLRAAGITSREMDVLALVAQGLTNAQIAERLFLSPRTVETHVANLLSKTGATGRGNLATYAGAQTP